MHPVLFSLHSLDAPVTRAVWDRRSPTWETRLRAREISSPSLKYAIENGIVTNWDDIEKVRKECVFTVRAAMCFGLCYCLASNIYACMIAGKRKAELKKQITTR